MTAEHAGRSLLRVDWDVDKPRRRAENGDRWRLLRAMLVLRRIMKSSNAANFSPPKKSSGLYLFIGGNERHDGPGCFLVRFEFSLDLTFHLANKPCSSEIQAQTS